MYNKEEEIYCLMYIENFSNEYQSIVNDLIDSKILLQNLTNEHIEILSNFNKDIINEKDKNSFIDKNTFFKIGIVDYLKYLRRFNILNEKDVSKIDLLFEYIVMNIEINEHQQNKSLDNYINSFNA